MIQMVPAIYEDGVFKPLKKIHLKEHQRLRLKLEIPKKDYNALLETLEILGDREQLRRIAKALRNVAKGNLLSHKKVFGRSQPNL